MSEIHVISVLCNYDITWNSLCTRNSEILLIASPVSTSYRGPCVWYTVCSYPLEHMEETQQGLLTENDPPFMHQRFISANRDCTEGQIFTYLGKCKSHALDNRIIFFLCLMQLLFGEWWLPTCLPHQTKSKIPISYHLQ
jgi:hypothetical protein